MPLSTREKKLILGFVGVLVVLFLWHRSTSDENQNLFLSVEENSFESERDGNSSLETEEVKTGDIYVHISGAVNLPGIYKLDTETRVVDVVNLAGGFLENADIDAINLAKKLTDEEKIYIPLQGEQQLEQQAVGNNDLSNTGSTNGLININTASPEELKKLPGVGDKTAEKIITYRQNSKFVEIEDIKNVPGIGDKKFLDFEDKICVR